MIRLHSGIGMQQRLDRMIETFKKQGETFVTYTDIYNLHREKHLH